MYYHPYFPFSNGGMFLSLFPSVPTAASAYIDPLQTFETKDEPQTGVPDQNSVAAQ